MEFITMQIKRIECIGLGIQNIISE
jgi:hypothetical protein